MRKIFWDNPYQIELTTAVAEVNSNSVLLNETIAFSFSGGQESDTGTINGFPILSSEIKDQLIYYTLDNRHNLSVGQEVKLEIDWLRRYRLMRLHFAAELILELVTQKINAQKIGAHISETKARIDFIYDKNISTIFPEILADYNSIIQKDAIIKTGFSDIETGWRFWEIEGFSKVPCGGTHVKSTAEVGFVILKRVNVGGGKERIEIKLVNS